MLFRRERDVRCMYLSGIESQIRECTKSVGGKSANQIITIWNVTSEICITMGIRNKIGARGQKDSRFGIGEYTKRKEAGYQSI